MKSAFVTGATGQDGSYMVDLLLQKKEEYHKIHVIVRFSSTPLDQTNMKHLLHHPKVVVHFGDVTDGSSVLNAIKAMVSAHVDAERFEIYNLAAQSHVGISFNCPTATMDANVKGISNILEAIVFLGIKEQCRVYQASTSEMFGKVQEVPQKETTPFHPRSPYGVSKLCAHWLVKNYRETHGIFACCGILFNHESPRRGANFVTQKIVLGAVQDQRILELGNLDSKRDWGHAKDYVEAMWMMLQGEEADEYVVATGRMVTVREFCQKVYRRCGVNLAFRGSGLDEVGYDEETGEVRIRVNPKFYRPCEVDQLQGDPSHIVSKLGWRTKYDLDAMIDDMVTSKQSI